LNLATADYTLEVRPTGSTSAVATYEAPLSTLGLDGDAITVVASGFLDPTVNNNGPAFGLWVALPTGGALVELPTSTLGIDDFKNSNTLIYPNPVKDILHINLEKTMQTQVEVYDISGRLVKEKSIKNLNNTLDTSQLQSGIYLIKISNIEGVFTSKISVE
jgi:hypothetical protein